MEPWGDDVRPPWMEQAECRSADAALFFAKGHSSAERAALAWCAFCPVRRECLEHALARPERFGIWGGTTPAQRGWNCFGKVRLRLVSSHT